MEKETGSSNREEPFEIDWSQHAADDSDEKAQEEPAPKPDLPAEPELTAERADDDYNAGETLATLLNFHLYGQREPHAVPDASADRPVAALLHPYRELTRIRHDYPLCLTDDADVPVRTLTAIVDGVALSFADDGDVGERRRQHLLRLETAIRELAADEPGLRLSRAWERAGTALLADAPDDEKRRLLEQSFGAARELLTTDGDLLPCGDGTLRRLFTAALGAYWRSQSMVWREEFEALMSRAEGIIEAADEHSSEAKSPEHLRESAGTDDVDFDAMSKLLRSADLGAPLPEARRKRIEGALAAMRKVKPLFDGTALPGRAEATLPFDTTPVVNNCAAARDRHALVMRTMVDFFRAVRIAELETGNRYRESVHDRYFARFDATYLTREERMFCPPVVLFLDDEFFVKGQLGDLLELLTSDVPVKVFVTLDDIAGGEDAVDQIPAWRARLGAIAASLGNVFVAQSSASQPLFLSENASSALSFVGPSLVSAFTGVGDSSPGIPPYLNAAAAAESRLFPAFRYDPSRGDTQAERMDVSENPIERRKWSEAEFSFRTSGGEDRHASVAFTPADFLFHDVRFDDHFWRLPPDKWHERMVPFAEFLDASEADNEFRVPYLLAVDSEMRVERIVVGAHILRIAHRVASQWHALQESGGIDNSFVAREVAAEKERLEAAKRDEVEAVERKYAANLERDLGDLTREIVQRIASQLISGDVSAIPASAPPRPAAPASTPAAEPTPAEDTDEAPADAEEAGADEAMSFDDPYIDTPLCTSCNECTKINNRMFAYDGNKQAFIEDADAGTFDELVRAAELCPVHIIHPGKPRNPDEPNLDDLVERAKPFN